MRRPLLGIEAFAVWHVPAPAGVNAVNTVNRVNSVKAVNIPRGLLLLACSSNRIEDSSARVLVGGSFLEINGQPSSELVRLLPDGTRDPAFAVTLGPGSDVLGLAAQADGRILIAGQFTNVNGVTRNSVARLQPDGSLDLSFDPGVGVGDPISNGVHAIAVLASEKVLLAGAFTSFNGVSRPRIALLNPDGSLDPTFNPDPDQIITAIAVQSDGKIIVGGDFLSIGGISRKRIARINSDGSLDATFNPSPGVTVPNSFGGLLSFQTISSIRIQQDENSQPPLIGRILAGWLIGAG